MRRGAIGQERRSMAMPDATVASEGRQFTGRAVVFDKWTMIGGPEWGFRERVADGSATKTLRESDVVFLDNHNSDRPISRTSAGTLRLSVDADGLPVDSDLDTRISYINDLALNVENRNVKGMSFGFEVVKDEWVRGSDGIDERTIREFKLFEVSATAFPAYTATDAAVRSAVLAAKIHRGSLTADEVRHITGLPVLLDTEEMVDALTSEPADEATRSDDKAEPPHGTRAEVALLRLRMQGLKALHGL